VPSFSADPNDAAYFSVDGGVTSIVGFNQYYTGDFGDFGPLTDACSGGGHGGPAGLIQDAFLCNNETGEAFTSASPEYKMLEAIGYNPLTGAVPEPSAWSMMMLGFAGLGFAGRRASGSRSQHLT
jgi:PEP-CTERM motif